MRRSLSLITFAAIVGLAIPAAAQGPKPKKSAKADAPTAPSAVSAPDDDAVLPPPPKVTDPMLAPLAPPARTLGTWSEVLSLVRSRSTDLRIAYDEVERAAGQSRVALAGALTQLNAQGSLTHNFLQGEYPLGPTTSLSYPTRNVLSGDIILDQPVIATRQWYAIGTSKRIDEVAKISVDDRKRRLAVGVADALVAEIAAERVAELNRVGLRQALERLALANRRQELGSGTQLDVVRSQQDVDAARQSLVAGDESARQDREALGLALGIPEQVGAASTMNIDGLVQDTGTGCKLVNRVDDRADIRVLRGQMEIAARGVNDVWYQFAPKVDFMSTLAASNDVLAIPNTTWNIQGVLTIPLWDGGARYGQLKTEKALHDEAEQQLIAEKRAVIIEVERARRAVDVAQDAQHVAADSREHSAQVDHMTQVGFLTGQGTSLDLVISAAGLRQAEINLALRDFDLVRARIEALLALADCRW